MASIDAGVSLASSSAALNSMAGSASWVAPADLRPIAAGVAATFAGAGGVRSGNASAAKGDAGLQAYAQAAQRMAAAGTGKTTDNPQVAAQIARLKAADAAVRAHEAAHIAAGGSLVRGAASFTYETGPDGKQYAVAGEVGIDLSSVAGDPQATIDKMATVRAAALAPADPSSTDRAVAAAAAQREAAARAELSRGPQQEALSAYTAVLGPAAEPVFQAAA